MNRDNVDALEMLLDRGILREYAAGRASCQDVGRFLASCGVLMPGVLSDEQTAAIWHAGKEDDGEVWENKVHCGTPKFMRAEMERTAKGEA